MYSELVQKALLANRESKNIEFKSEFDPSSRAAWCEVIKDIAAIANSGGGIIIFGLENNGKPSRANLDLLTNYDPADITNKITSFTGTVDIGIEIVSLAKDDVPLIGFLIAPSSFPVVFEKPGTYDPANASKGSAFAQGTIYFRHGAKSAPARGSDLHNVVQRIVRDERKSWLSKVRKVTTAPAGSRIITIPASSKIVTNTTRSSLRAVDDPTAMPVLLTRDPSKTTGEFIHEKISPQLFDEINNIIDLNRLLAAGRERFVLSPELYFKIYATRALVTYSRDDFKLFLRCALVDEYLPGLFWATKLPPEDLGQVLSELYLFPHPAHTHYLMRISVLLGSDFCEWLFQQWKRKWKNSIQKPSFYYTFEQMFKRTTTVDPIIVSSRLTATWHKSFPEEKPLRLSELIIDRAHATKLLNKTCTELSERKNDSSLRGLARDLDYIVHGNEIMQRRDAIIASLKTAIGNKTIANVIDEATGATP